MICVSEYTCPKNQMIVMLGGAISGREIRMKHIVHIVFLLLYQMENNGFTIWVLDGFLYNVFSGFLIFLGLNLFCFVIDFVTLLF